jgi:membrane associated rhomboid family serine protease
MFKLVHEAIDDILWPSVFVMFFWLAFFTNQAYDLNLNQYGIAPRSLSGLRGILFSPFLHGDFGHLFSNTIPFLVSGSFLFHFFKQLSWKIFGLIWFISGFGVWLIGDFYSIHIGASGLVYGLVAFLLTGGIIRKNRNLAAVSLVLIFLYGSMVWGIFPQISMMDANISWEGHLFGALAGIGFAWVFRHEGPEEEYVVDDNEQMPEWWIRMKEEEEALKGQQDDESKKVRITFRYKNPNEE